MYRYFSFLLQQVDIRMEEVELLRLLNFVQLVLAILYQRTESDEEKKLLNSFKVLDACALYGNIHRTN